MLVLTHDARLRWENVLLLRISQAQLEMTAAEGQLSRLRDASGKETGDPAAAQSLDRAEAARLAAYRKCDQALKHFNDLVIDDRVPEAEPGY